MSASTRSNMRERPGTTAARGVGRTAALAAAFYACVAPLAHAGDMDGQWARGDGNAKVVVAPCGGDVCATNTWIKPGTPKEKNGDKLVMSITSDAPGSYSGSAFDPQRNMTYRITVTVEGDRMTTKGCIVAGLLCKGVEWTRIN